MTIATIKKHRFTFFVALLAVSTLLLAIYDHWFREHLTPQERHRRIIEAKRYPGKTWHKPSDKYPGGMLEVTMNGTHFEVPGEPEYLAQMPYNREFFDINVLWPEMRSSKLFHPTPYPQRRFDNIWAGFSISRRWSEQSPDQRSKPFHIESEAIRHRRYEQVSKENPDLLAYPYKDKDGKVLDIWYTPRDPGITMPNGDRWEFSCDAPIELSPDLSDADRYTLEPRCGSVVVWDNGLEMYFRFYRKHLKDAIPIYQALLALRDSWVVKTPKQTISSTEK